MKAMTYERKHTSRIWFCCYGYLNTTRIVSPKGNTFESNFMEYLVLKKWSKFVVSWEASVTPIRHRRVVLPPPITSRLIPVASLTFFFARVSPLSAPSQDLDWDHLTLLGLPTLFQRTSEKVIITMLVAWNDFFNLHFSTRVNGVFSSLSLLDCPKPTLAGHCNDTVLRNHEMNCLGESGRYYQILSANHGWVVVSDTRRLSTNM